MVELLTNKLTNHLTNQQIFLFKKIHYNNPDFLTETRLFIMQNASLRYFENAKSLLKNSLLENDTYTDVKYVQEGCGTAYLAVLKAIDEYLLARGLSEKDLPKSVEGYRAMLHKHLAMYNGKLTKKFEELYYELHIAGYYRGLLRGRNVIKEVFKEAEKFIAMVRPKPSGRK